MFAEVLNLPVPAVDALPVREFFAYVGYLEQKVADQKAALERINRR